MANLRVKRIQMLVTGFTREISNTTEPKPIIHLIFEFYKRDVIVMDFGSAYSKVGLAGDDVPKDVFPTVIGRPAHSGVRNIGFIQWMGPGSKPSNKRRYGGLHCAKNEVWCVGHEAKKRRGLLSLKYPVEHGIICNWNDMEAIMNYAFKIPLEILSKESQVLMAETPLNPLANREKMTQIMFEKFEVNQFCLKLQSCLALYASGRTTGLVVDSGADVTHTVPIYEGNAVRDAILSMNIAGRALTATLMKISVEREYSFTTNAEREIVRDIKETMAYVAYDYEEEISKCESSNEIERDYKLPDDQIVTFGNERFRCVEPLFCPSFIGLSQSGIHDLAYDSIMKCDLDIRKTLCSNIVLEGGSTMVPGFKQRLKKEIVRKMPNDYDVNVIQPPNANHSVFIGGSIFITMEDCEEMWITKEDYDECGPSIVHQKCL